MVLLFHKQRNRFGEGTRLAMQALAAECTLASKGAGFHGECYIGKTGQSQ